MAIETDSTQAAGAPAPQALQSASARDRLATLFPDPSAPSPPWWRRRRQGLIAVIAIVVIGSLVLAAQAFGAENATYRTATVGTHDVDALLNGVATIEPVSQASVAFPAKGTVATVNVKVGDSVTVAQALASLDPQALTQTLHEKQAALAQAQLTLEKALNGESVSGGSGSGNNSVRLTAVSMPNGHDTPLSAAQQAVLDAQKKVDAALNSATKAIDAAAIVCATAGVGTSTPTTPTADELTACQTATKDVLTAQQAVSTAQQELATASKALDALLAEQAAAAAQSGSGNTTGSGSNPSNGAVDGGSSSGSTNTPAASSPSSADLVSYQKAVDAAEADVAVAVQAIAQATIVSPIAGTVEAVNVAVGDAVTSGSTTANIVVVGAGGYEATTTVSIDDITAVKVGQRATVLPDGSKQPLEGHVASIGITPDSASTTTSYRVVIGLADSNAKLDNGSAGSVAIVTESAKAALAVPTSAVTTIGTRHLVTVLDGSTTTRVVVEVGVVGETWTEIKDGVKAGQQVVLADLSEPLPGSATDSSGSTSNQPGGGQFPGGGPTFRFGGPPGQ